MYICIIYIFYIYIYIYISMSWLDGITDAMYMNLGKLKEMVRYRETWHEE